MSVKVCFSLNLSNLLMVLFQEDLEIEAYPGYVSKAGEVYIQTTGPELIWINQILDLQGTEKISKHKLTSFRQLTMNKLYLAKYIQDNCFYRAIVKSATSNCYKQNKVSVENGSCHSLSSQKVSEHNDCVFYQFNKVKCHNSTL